MKAPKTTTDRRIFLISSTTLALADCKIKLKHWRGLVSTKAVLAFPWHNDEIRNELTSHHQEAEPAITPVKVDALRQQLMMIHYWAFVLIVKLTYSRLTASNTTFSPGGSANLVRESIQLVQNILNIIPHLLSDEAGMTPPSRSILPLRLAISALKDNTDHMSKRLTQACEDLLNVIAEKKGVRHSGAVKRISRNLLQELT